MHDEAAGTIWVDDPAAISRQQALASTDSAIRALAEQVPEGFVIADLRDAEVGDGFSWGRFGPNPRIVRHGADPIFAYGRPRLVGDIVASDTSNAGQPH